MKKQASQAVVWVILILLVVGLFGYGSMSFSGSAGRVARVGDREISINRYAREFQAQVNQISAQTGQRFSASDAFQYGLDRAVLTRLVGEAALNNEADALGLSVSDKTVGDQIYAMPAFQGAGGGFDRLSYEGLLERNNFQPAEFEDQIRADTARSLLSSAVAAGAVMPDAATTAILNWAGERRDVTWAALTPDMLEAVPADPSDEELKAQYDAAPEAYTLPETRAITYAWLTPDMLVPGIEIDDAVLQKAYDDNAAEYKVPERRLVERLIYAAQADADAASARIAAGEASFDDLVQERGLELADIDMGDVTEGELGAAGAAVFALDGPGVTTPQPTNLGPALFRVNAILPAEETSFEDARAALAEDLAMDAARRQIETLYSDIEDRIAGGATLEDLAGSTQMELGTIDWREGVEDGIAAYPDFRTAAAAANTGDYPKLTPLSDGGIFALRLDEIRPPALQPMDEVREQLTADWVLAETTRQLTERAEIAAADLETGANWDATALSPATAEGLTRGSPLEGAPEGLVAAAFGMQPGAVKVMSTGTDVAVFRLDAVRPAEIDDATRVRLGAQLTQSLSEDIINAFTDAARDAAGVTIDQGTVNAVNAQFR